MDGHQRPPFLGKRSSFASSGSFFSVPSLYTSAKVWLGSVPGWQGRLASERRGREPRLSFSVVMMVMVMMVVVIVMVVAVPVVDHTARVCCRRDRCRAARDNRGVASHLIQHPRNSFASFSADLIHRAPDSSSNLFDTSANG